LDINDLVCWLIYLAFLKMNGLLEDDGTGVRLVSVGDAIPGDVYAG